jgi:hypothetical protein
VLSAILISDQLGEPDAGRQVDPTALCTRCPISVPNART